MTRPPHEPPLAPEVANAKGLRTGWTTGTSASAAAKAAVIGLQGGAPPSEVEVRLPRGQRVRFVVTDVDRRHPGRAAVVKDAGDDPDVTDGARVTARQRSGLRPGAVRVPSSCWPGPAWASSPFPAWASRSAPRR